MLAGLDLTFDAGSYTLVAGPTGSGKSTLVLAVIGALDAGTDAEWSGQCLIDGRDIADVSAAERASLVAAVWQSPQVQLFRDTVLDEVRAGLDYRCLPAHEVDRRAREALQLVGLAHLDETHDPARLSGGEQQRLALAAALVLDAPVLVLDEASSALDADAVQAFGQALDQARVERGVTVIAVDHRLAAHRQRADRCLVLDQGQMVLDGTVPQVLVDQRARAEALGLRVDDQTAASVPGQAQPAAATNEPRALRASGLTLQVPGRTLVDAADIDLPTGAIALLTGANGTGKTTLLQALAGRGRAAQRRIRPKVRQRISAGIGMAGQRAADLLLGRTVRAELAQALGHDRARDADAAQVDQLLELAGLGGMSERHPLRLSGGQRQRLAVACAVAGAPKLVLLDEPTSSQDRTGIARVRALLERESAERVTVIATHDPHLFADLATHRLHVQGRRLEQVPR